MFRPLRTPSVFHRLKTPQRYLTSQPPPRRKEKYNYNPSPFAFEENNEHTNYKRMTADELATYRTPPKRTKMLVRDFIHDSLYNPNYGYFPKNAVIFSPADPFDFGKLHNQTHFQEAVAEKYAEYGAVSEDSGFGPGRQVWHTPTELFKPFYGQAIAQCLVSEYMLRYFPYEDLVIYEMGAGNGTLARNVLDYIRDKYPEVYERTRYRIIEISPNLAEIQRGKLCADHPCVDIVNKSIFDWDTNVPVPCFFLALEVIDNFPHDLIRYRLDDLKPYQGLTAIDENGDFEELYEPVQDPLIRRFLNYRDQIGHQSPALASPFISSPSLRYLRQSLPFAPNLTPKPEFVPTRLLTFLEVLRDKFPLHRLLLSDFSTLPDSMKGYNTPVVQTRYKNTMVPVETYMVQQGYFDIFFPTSFELLRDMYELVMGMPRKVELGDQACANALPLDGCAEAIVSRPSPMASTSSSLRLGANFFSSGGRRLPEDGINSSSGLAVGQRLSNVYTHKEFMERYANLDATRLRNGENPLLDFYHNVKFLF